MSLIKSAIFSNRAKGSSEKTVKITNPIIAQGIKNKLIFFLCFI
jgi:hypothetical protein